MKTCWPCGSLQRRIWLSNSESFWDHAILWCFRLLESRSDRKKGPSPARTAVIVTISSDEFVFTRAGVLLLRQDNPLETASGGYCQENVLSDLTINEPGTYELVLSLIELRHASRGETISLKGFMLPWTIEFTQEDLDQGTKTVSAPPDGVFRITVVDGQHIPIPHHVLLAGTRDRTHEISLDASGSALVYGNPSHCFISIDAGVGVCIEHLDLKKL
jgi:hypothetical protein